MAAGGEAEDRSTEPGDEERGHGPCAESDHRQQATGDIVRGGGKREHAVEEAAGEEVEAEAPEEGAGRAEEEAEARGAEDVAGGKGEAPDEGRARRWPATTEAC